MATTNAQVVEPQQDVDAAATCPVTAVADFVELITESGGTYGLRAQDAANATNPESDIADAALAANAEYKIVRRDRQFGTTGCLRLRYDSATTALTTSPVVAVFGRVDSSGPWMRMITLANEDTSFTMAPDFTYDATDSANSRRYTYPVRNRCFDTYGLCEFIAVVETAAAGNTGGSLSNMALEVWFI